eukprot:8041-Heterococcus_DN1.PRE.3
MCAPYCYKQSVRVTEIRCVSSATATAATTVQCRVTALLANRVMRCGLLFAAARLKYNCTAYILNFATAAAATATTPANTIATHVLFKLYCCALHNTSTLATAQQS